MVAPADDAVDSKGPPFGPSVELLVIQESA